MEQKKNASSNGLVLLKSAINSTKVQERLEQCVRENKGAYASSILDLYSGDKSLQECNPNAIIAECLKAAAFNLPINKALGFAYVVVYKNSVKQSDGSWKKVPTPTFILGYKGYIQLAMRTGQYLTINADVVYKGELRGKDKLSGSIDLSGAALSNEIIGYFAHFEMLNGFKKTLYMSLDDMARYALRYAPSLPNGTTKEDLIKKANDGAIGKQVGWMGNFNDMAIKTCIRRLISKYGYMSIEMQEAYSKDIESDMAMSQRQEAIESAKVVEIDMTQRDNVEADLNTAMQNAEPVEAMEVNQGTGEIKRMEIEEDDVPGY